MVKNILEMLGRFDDAIYQSAIQSLDWMAANRHYAMLLMVLSVHIVSFGFCWAAWRHYALGWPWDQAFGWQ